MLIDLDAWEKLPTQEQVYNDDLHEIVMQSAGLGCISEDTILHTINGESPCGDIQKPQVYFSKNEKHQLSLFLGTAPYLKGKDYLYRVIHEQGEFVATAEHQIFCEGYNYLPLGEVLKLHGRQTVRVLSPTSQELDLKSFALSDPSLRKKSLSYLDDCAECIHQYGQQLPQAKGNDQLFFPLQFDAHKLDRIYQDLLHSKHKDDLVELKQSHIRPFQFDDRHAKQDYTYPSGVLASAFLNEDVFARYFEHILQYNRHQLSRLFLGFSECRQIIEKLAQYHICKTYLKPLTTSAPDSLSRIVKIEKLKKDWYWDLHIFGSNNYLSSNSYHHNSGKTHVLCRKLLKLSAINRGFSGAILAPTYKDFRRDIKPEMFQILEDHLGLTENKHFWFHKSSSEFSFIWNKKPLYVLTGEKPIAGPNLAYCGINEFSLIQYERIKEMLRRVRVKEAPLKQRLMVGTPENIHGWLEDFVELQQEKNKTKQDNFAIYFADTRENTFVDDSYREHLETMLDSHALKVFAGGQIVRLTGNYYYYAFTRKKNIQPVQYDKSKIIHVGLDFNVGKMAAHFGHDYGSGEQKEYCVFDELLLEGDSNTPKMAEAIANRYPKDKIIITCDAAGKNRKTTGKTDVQSLKSHGFEVRFRAANPRHKERQLLVNGLLYKSRIKIDPKCKGLIKDLEKVQQRKEDFSKEKDKDDKLTHFSDGLDYVIDFEFTINMKRSRQIQL